MEPLMEVKRPFKTSYQTIGFWKDYFITIAFRDGILAIWQTGTIKKVMDIPIAHCLSGHAMIHNDTLYLSSRAINSIERIHLNRLVWAD